MDHSKFDNNGQLKNGLFNTFFKDGSLSTVGEYVDGRKTGEWHYYLNNGLLKAAGYYENDIMIGEWVWYRKNCSGRLLSP